MNRRSFLAVLGVAPAVLPALPEPVKQVPLEGEIIPPGVLHSNIGAVSIGVLRSADGSVEFDFTKQILRCTGPDSAIAEAFDGLA